MTTPIDIRVTFDVVAYDSGGYGDNRGKTFTNEEDAVKYAESLEPRFGASVTKHITMSPISRLIFKEGKRVS